MPTYEYKCQSCGQIVEMLIRVPGDDDQHRCPACGGETLERRMSVPAVLRASTIAPGTTCCGRSERCEAPPCSTGGTCHRH